jgi:hypothetical protein
MSSDLESETQPLPKIDAAMPETASKPAPKKGRKSKADKEKEAMVVTGTTAETAKDASDLIQGGENQSASTPATATVADVAGPISTPAPKKRARKSAAAVAADEAPPAQLSADAPQAETPAVTADTTAELPLDQVAPLIALQNSGGNDAVADLTPAPKKRVRKSAVDKNATATESVSNWDTIDAVISNASELSAKKKRARLSKSAVPVVAQDAAAADAAAADESASDPPSALVHTSSVDGECSFSLFKS